MMRNFVLIGLMVLMLAAALMLTSQQPTTAQPKPVNFRALLERLNTEGSRFTIQVAAPFIAGETLLSLPDTARQLSDIGDDYLCVSQPWNDGSRTYCTPYTNVVSISFIE